MKKIAFFDFDGTITKKDSLLEFIKFSKGNFRFYLGFLLNSPYLVAYKLKIISNQKAKEKILEYFFRDMPVEKFEMLCNEFTQQRIPEIIRPAAIKEIEGLKKNGVEVVIVSASPENWIGKWARKMDIKWMATCLQAVDGKITGRIAGLNCHGKEKLNRILKTYDLHQFEEVYAYGDSAGDKLMFSVANRKFLKPFR